MTTKKKAHSKKRNPQDATFRNINALKKRVGALEFKVDFLWRNSIGRLPLPGGRSVDKADK